MYKLIKIALGPFAIVFAWWFMTVAVPQLDAATQEAIEHGALGMLIGIFGGAVVFSCCAVAWTELTDLLQSKRTT